MASLSLLITRLEGCQQEVEKATLNLEASRLEQSLARRHRLLSKLDGLELDSPELEMLLGRIHWHNELVLGAREVRSLLDLANQ